MFLGCKSATATAETADETASSLVYEANEGAGRGCCLSIAFPAVGNALLTLAHLPQSQSHSEEVWTFVVVIILIVV